MSKKIKCCVYLVQDKCYPEPNFENTSKEYKEFFSNRSKFLDIGDDPSFYCSKTYNSNVTWGVCRHNVRQGLKLNDEIHFVACDKTEKYFWKYYYVGFGVVKNTLTHKDIWNNEKYLLFQNYFNYLIKPNKNSFDHFEQIPNEYWHDDWKMRISSERTYKKLSEIEEDLEHGICGYGVKKGISNSKINNQFPFGNNYILFDKEQSFFNLNNPTFLAEVKWNGRNLFTEWVSKNIRLLFSYNELKDSFTHKGRQHPAFDLHPEKANKLRNLINI